MSFTYVNANAAGGGSSSVGSIGVAVTGVHAGDLVVVGVKFEGSTTTVSVSDGTTTFTQDPDGVQGNAGSQEPWTCVSYLLSSVASGTLTYTATFGANRTWTSICVMVYTPSAACSFDNSNTGTGNSTAVSSGSTVIAGTDGVAFGFYGEYGNAINVLLINGLAAEHSIFVDPTGNTQHDVLWSRAYSSGFTGAASGSLSSAERWNCTIMSFQIGGGGAAVFIPLVGGPGGMAGMPLAGSGGGLAG